MAKEKQIKDIKERVKSFEDALAVTGRPALPDVSNVPADLKECFEERYRSIVVVEALNEGWSPDWTDHNQQKWFPWFHHPVSSSGFVFLGASYYFSLAAAGYGSRLCFKDSEMARYFGEQFIDICNKILLK